MTQCGWQAEDRVECRIQAKLRVREQQAWVWKAGDECQSFAPVSQSISQTSESNLHLRNQSGKVRPRSFLMHTFSQGKEETDPSPDTTCYTAPWTPIY